MELDLTRLASVGTTEHESAQQRELQYMVAVAHSPVTMHRVGNFNYTASGSRIYLKRFL